MSSYEARRSLRCCALTYLKSIASHSDSGNSNVGAVWGGGNSQGPQAISCRREIYQARHLAQVEYVKRHLDLGLDKSDWSVDSGDDDDTGGKSSGGKSSGGKSTGLSKVSIDNHSTNNSDNTNNVNDQSNVQDFSGAGNVVGAGMRCGGKRRRALDRERRHLSLGDGIIQSFGLVARSDIPMTGALAVREIGVLAEELGVRGVVNKGAPSPLRRRLPGIICNTRACDEVARRSADDLLRMHARSLGFVL